MQTLIYLARHGETHWNKIKRLQGHLDSALTETGKLQCLQVARQLQDKDIDVIISSPLGRAVASAKICQNVLNTERLTINNLAERNLGDWQGQLVTHLSSLADYGETLQQVTDLPAPNGESAVACGQRIHASLTDIGQRFLGKNVLVVFHGEALRCLLHLLGKNSDNDAFRLYKNGCIVGLSFKTSAPHFHFI